MGNRALNIKMLRLTADIVSAHISETLFPPISCQASFARHMEHSASQADLIVQLPSGRSQRCRSRSPCLPTTSSA